MTAPPPSVQWYSSFYWRIGISFVIFVVVVIVAQSLMVGYARSNGAFAPGNPNATAAAIAAELGAALTNDPNLDLSRFLAQTVPDRGPSAYVVMADGRVGSASTRPLRADIERQARAALAGEPPVAAAGDAPTGPVVTAPIQVDRRLAGLVILPPPPPRGLLANVGELLSLPGTLALVAITAIAALVIFAPARNRLRALEQAAERLGAGQLDTRAPAQGRDEIARVATAFNHMAADLEQQSEALRLSDRLRRQMLADISHELRTPLTTMRGYLDTLDMPEIMLDEDKRKRYVETARRETLRLERIVADLLELARFENGVAALDARVVAIERVLDRRRAPVRARRRRREGDDSNPRGRVCRSDRRGSRSARPGDQQSRRQRAAAHAARRHDRSRSRGGRRRLSADGDRFGQRHRARARRARVRSVLQGGLIEIVRARAEADSACQSPRRSSSVTAARSRVTSRPGRTALRHHAAAGDAADCRGDGPSRPVRRHVEPTQSTG